MNDPKNVKHWVWRIAMGLIALAVTKGVFAALAERGIHPDLWVTRSIDGAATLASTSTQVIGWFLAALAGVTILILFDRLIWPRMANGNATARKPDLAPAPTKDKRQSNVDVSPSMPFTPASSTTVSHRQAVPDALQLSVGESGGYFHTDSRTSHQMRRTLNLKIENTDPHTPVTGIKVQVMRVDPHEYDGPWELCESFSLAAGDHKFISLVEYGEARSVEGEPIGDSFMIVCTLGTLQPKPEAKGHHVISLKAVSWETSPTWLACRVWVDAEGQLRIAGDQIALNKAAEQAFAKLQGTAFGDEIERIGGSTEEILRTVMFNLARTGEITGVAWPAKQRVPVPNIRKFVISPSENCLRYTHGDRPVYTELTTTQAVVDEFVRYGTSVSGAL